jgi:hypothetical protein
MAPVFEDGPIANVVSGEAHNCATAVTTTAIVRNRSRCSVMINILSDRVTGCGHAGGLSRLLPE